MIKGYLFDVVHAELDRATEVVGLARELQGERLRHAEARLLHRADLGHVRVARRLCVEKDERVVLGDAILHTHTPC